MSEMALRPRWLRLRSRFVIFVLSGVAVVALAMALISHQEASQALLKASQEHLLSLAQAQAAELGRRLESVSAAPRGLALSLEQVGVRDRDFALTMLREHMSGNPRIFGMALALAPAGGPTRRLFSAYVYRTPQGFKSMDLDSPAYDYPSQNWYLIPALLGRPVWSEPYFDEGGGGVLMTTYSAPMLAQGQVKGVVTADVSLQELEREVHSLDVGNRGYAFVLTQQGTFLAAPFREWVMRQSIFSLAEQYQRPDLRNLGQLMVRGRSGVLRVPDPRGGPPVWLAFAPVKEVGWSYVVAAPESEVLAPVQSLTRHQLYIAGVGLLIMGLVILVMVVGLTKPVQLLTTGARRLASGDLGSRVSGIRPGDEVGELADSFNTMAGDLQAHVAELQRKRKELEDSLHRIELLENIQNTLNKFVPTSVKARIAEAPEAPDLNKRETDVSVLFLDVAGYTRMSEQVAGEEMNFLIERYFSSFLDDIYQNKGDINETAGDGLMIIFQDQDPGQHAVSAVRCAVAIQNKVAQVNQELKGRFQPVTINIGVNSGAAQVGSSRFEGLAGTRWTFTASGPVTNTAARLGALATQGQIYIGPETAKRVQGRFALKDMGPQQLKNVAQPVQVFQVLGPLNA
ncbi:MAG: HAMP domain-containing protein [Desulfarculus sp.]|nr:MAG: HAMP domain-containing protein [Desulfarculus sp.]